MLAMARRRLRGRARQLRRRRAVREQPPTLARRTRRPHRTPPHPAPRRPHAPRRPREVAPPAGKPSYEEPRKHPNTTRSRPRSITTPSLASGRPGWARTWHRRSRRSDSGRRGRSSGRQVRSTRRLRRPPCGPAPRHHRRPPLPAAHRTRRVHGRPVQGAHRGRPALAGQCHERPALAHLAPCSPAPSSWSRSRYEPAAMSFPPRPAQTPTAAPYLGVFGLGAGLADAFGPELPPRGYVVGALVGSRLVAAHPIRR